MSFCVGRRTDIAGKDCIFSRQLIQNLRNILRMDWGPARLTHREIVETLARILIMAETCIEIGAVRLAFNQRNQPFQRVLHISD